jgi:hypothetical protein
MSKCSNEQFQQVVIAQKGSLYAPWYRLWIKNENISVVEELNMVSRPLEDKYTALTTDGSWSPSKDSIFRAAKQDQRKPSTRPGQQGQPRKHKYASREEWFDAQKCNKCGGHHPTYAHDDPAGYRARRPAKDAQKLRFKSNDSAKSFRQRVHQAMLDCCETDETTSHEEQHYIHMADADGFVDPADVEEGTYALEESDEDNGIAALVAAGLGNLLKE